MGHLKPGLEIAKELRGRKCKVDFIVNADVDDSRLELIRKEGFEVRKIRVGYFKRFGMRMIVFPFFIFTGFFDSWKILKNGGYDKVIGMGSYVSIPGVVAGWMMEKKIYLCEQNVFPGRANRFLARFADKIFLGFEESKGYFNDYGEKLIAQGNPIDKRLFEIGGRKENTKTLLVFGGSYGAGDINNAVIFNIEKFIENGFKVIHITGKSDYKRVMSEYHAMGVEMNDKLKVIDFTNDMVKYYKKADIIICRAGAGSLFEISAIGRKGIFVPHPNVIDDHQRENALAAKKLGYSMLEASELNDKLLDECIKLSKSKKKMIKLAKKYSAGKIADEIIA